MIRKTMTGTLIEKILSEHLVTGTLSPGQEIAIRIDQTLTQDITGTMAYLELEAMGVTRTSVPLAVSYVDHNTAQFGPNNQNDHRYLQTMAAADRRGIRTCDCLGKLRRGNHRRVPRIAGGGTGGPFDRSAIVPNGRFARSPAPRRLGCALIRAVPAGNLRLRDAPQRYA